MNDKVSISVGVIVTRMMLHHPWKADAWRPTGIVLGAPELRPGTPMWCDPDGEHFFAGTSTVSLHIDEIGSYQANLEQDAPLVYVVLESHEDATQEAPPSVHLVTVAPDDAESYQEGDATRVGAVAMPKSLAELLAAYIAENGHKAPLPATKFRRGGKVPRGQSGVSE